MSEAPSGSALQSASFEKGQIQDHLKPRNLKVVCELLYNALNLSPASGYWISSYLDKLPCLHL